MSFNFLVTHGNRTHIDSIARFQVEMAMESEGLALDHERVSKGVHAVMEDENKGQYIVATVDEVPVGSLMITREWSDWNASWYWWIQSVYVMPQYRKQGIFKAMYNKVLELAGNEGISQVRLYVDKHNFPAQEVYKKLGMAECHYSMYEVEL